MTIPLWLFCALSSKEFHLFSLVASILGDVASSRVLLPVGEGGLLVLIFLVLILLLIVLVLIHISSIFSRVVLVHGLVLVVGF